MYSGFLVGWRGGSVLGQFNDAASNTLEFADILTALSDNATNLQGETIVSKIKNSLVLMFLPVNLAQESRRSTAHRRYR